jgi:hypothetical protein
MRQTHSRRFRDVTVSAPSSIYDLKNVPVTTKSQLPMSLSSSSDSDGSNVCPECNGSSTYYWSKCGVCGVCAGCAEGPLCGMCATCKECLDDIKVCPHCDLCEDCMSLTNILMCDGCGVCADCEIDKGCLVCADGESRICPDCETCIHCTVIGCDTCAPEWAAHNARALIFALLFSKIRGTAPIARFPGGLFRTFGPYLC